MRRRTLPFFMGLLLAAVACGPAQVVVTVEIDVDNPDGDGMITRPLSDVEVQLIPFDRDQVFDSMTSAFATPEPPVPPELIAARDEVQAAQQAWQALQNRWNTLRDTLQKINDELGQYSRGEARYVALFREWQDFDAELTRVDRNVNAAFDRFNQLQQGTIRRSDSVRILRDNWADEAYAGSFEVFNLKVRASGLDQVYDTTDASGVARANLRVKPGVYWVHARYALPYTELYWNEMITVVRGEPNEIRLTRANAEERIKL